ncbi:MAG: DUF1365 domain-containing protein [Desulfatiglandaceae bacterium]
MKSCLYRGKVRHRRFTPVLNTFQYRLYMIYLDLAEFAHVFDSHPLWSTEHVNLAYFRRRDHLGPPHIPLDRAVRDLVQAQVGMRPNGPIRLLTHLRYFGYCFNPVSFYYCYDPPDRRIEALVAEVHNTPWLEEHCYVFGEAMNVHPHPGWKQYCFDKVFHVSPFMEMNIRYDWRFHVPDEMIHVQMNLMTGEKKRFDATLELKREPITRRSLTRVLLAYPLMTWKVTAMIYRQALRLKLKGVPVHAHPGKAGSSSAGTSS